MNSSWRRGLPDELEAARELLWSHGEVCTEPIAEPESAQYGAFAFSVQGEQVRFRIAKTTPTKPGQFVTVWQRSEEGPIRPFDLADGVRYFIISVGDTETQGYFIFPLEVLLLRDIVSRNGVGGKRGFRVYPPWVSPTNPQARRAQSWQLEFYKSAIRSSPKARADA
ncbi:MepB family protein [Nocardia sp. NPDC051030]|uniref:MepB family protein n=1 Tax=Nocardia sp. NPDC051030 TaxID=3155162 RepID=UPI00341610F9